MVQNKLSTRYNLKKIGLLRENGNSCQFECEERESISHLFSNYSFVKIIWIELLKWLEVPSNIPHEVASYIESVVGLLGREGASKSYLARIWNIMAWNIWKDGIPKN